MLPQVNPHDRFKRFQPVQISLELKTKGLQFIPRQQKNLGAQKGFEFINGQRLKPFDDFRFQKLIRGDI